MDIRDEQGLKVSNDILKFLDELQDKNSGVFCGIGFHVLRFVKDGDDGSRVGRTWGYELVTWRDLSQEEKDKILLQFARRFLKIRETCWSSPL